MTGKSLFRFGATLAVLIGINGCERKTDALAPATFPTDSDVFLDEFTAGLDYEAFENSKLDALGIDGLVKYKGSKSLKFTVPDVGDPSGWFAGGAFPHSSGRDLSGYDALTFWTRASMIATVGVAGFGNDNSGTLQFVVGMPDLPVNTVWKKYIIPIPNPAKLTHEKGLFYMAAGAVDSNGFEVWFDEVQYEKLGTIAFPRPVFTSETLNLRQGDSSRVDGTEVTFDVAGTDQTVLAAQGYFDFTSSNVAVATVDSVGVIRAVDTGTAIITGKLGSVDAPDSVIVNVSGAPAAPTIPAPTPTLPSTDVISLFSNAYTNSDVDTWSADWDDADVEDVQIAGDDTKLYTNLSFAGIEFYNPGPEIDATAMTHFHMDIWTPDPTTAPAIFKIKLVNDVSGSVSEHELTFNDGSSPPLISGNWISIDVPLAAFSGLAATDKLGQLIISGDPNTVYVDNIYFYRTATPGIPTIAAPTPTVPAGQVISLFSDAYTNVIVDTWSAAWDFADVEDFLIGADSTKKYTNLLRAGIELRSAPVDASAMTHFHMDVWTPDPTASPSTFKVMLVDFGPNGIYEPSGGDDVSHELTFDHTIMVTGLWVRLDVRLSDFTGLTTRAAIGQIILSGNPDTVYVDNIYFYDSGMPTEPTAPAPTPALPQTDVISLFSDAYADVPVDHWSAPWDSADVSDYFIGSDVTKRYTNLLFAGIEFTSPTIDASAMTHFHMDIWTPDPTAAPAIFKIKLVDFGANGIFDGGDDTEHELTFTAATVPSLATGSWVSFDIPLTDFIGLTTRAHMAQLIIVADPNTVFVDNVYFHK